jgi:hypothetical protein
MSLRTFLRPMSDEALVAGTEETRREAREKKGRCRNGGGVRHRP